MHYRCFSLVVPEMFFSVCTGGDHSTKPNLSTDLPRVIAFRVPQNLPQQDKHRNLIQYAVTGQVTTLVSMTNFLT